MFKIEVADSPYTFGCAPDDTLTRAGQRAGLGIPYECNVGSCGTCKLELLSGTVESIWPDAPALTERDRTRGRILGCQSRPTSDCKVKARILDQYQPVCRPRPFEATLTSVRNLTPDLREFCFRLDKHVEFRPGQYALLYLPGVAGARAYSMSNIWRGDGRWDFQVKNVAGGAGSTALFERMQPGDTVRIDGPYGMAYLRTDSPRDTVCIAGGSGLAPVLSIARGMADTPEMATRKLHFFYGGRRPEDLCGEDMLRELPGYGTGIFYHPIISVPESQDPGYWSGKVGFVHDLALETMGKALAEHEVYFAGPPAMAAAVLRMLIQEKVPPAQIHYDQFY